MGGFLFCFPPLNRPHVRPPAIRAELHKKSKHGGQGETGNWEPGPQQTQTRPHRLNDDAENCRLPTAAVTDATRGPSLPWRQRGEGCSSRGSGCVQSTRDTPRLRPDTLDTSTLLVIAATRRVPKVPTRRPAVQRHGGRGPKEVREVEPGRGHRYTLIARKYQDNSE